ncbi:MAG: phenylalanine--tRNA ligase subunit alpha [Acidiphilium sp.]
MSDELAAIENEARAAVAEAGDPVMLDAARVAFLGKSGRVTALLKSLGGMAPEQRKAFGAAVNAVKDNVAAAIERRRAVLEAAALESRLATERIDVTLPARPERAGSIHPISRTVEELTALFGAMGFGVKDGPDIEDDWYNFGALNIPAHHPARAMMDTFYLNAASRNRDAGDDGRSRPMVLRTHTSPLQIRTMLAERPPFRVIVPGRTYRSDHDATHSPMFHQCEGLVIDRGITLAHLKGCLLDFLRAYFELPGLKARFRSSYFPFTEPSMEVDIAWDRKSGAIGGGSDWLEILGAGMVHPNVLANCGLDPREYQGFAFGMGVERITMLKHGIPDLRPFYESDIRWLAHYGASPLAPVTLHEGDAR